MRATPKLILIVLLALFASLSVAFAQESVAVTDVHGEDVIIEDTSRIITIGGSVTEIVFALGAGDQVVARDDSSLYPLEVNALESVGYIRTLSAEPVLSLAPTLIITTEDVGPPEAVEQLEATGVTMLIVPAGESIEEVITKIEMIAQALSAEETGAELIATIEADYAEAQTLLENVESKPRVMFIYARGAGAVSVAGTNTSAMTMIEMAGGENAITEVEGYQPITAESVVAANPDIILMMTRGLDSLGGIEGLLEQPGIAQTTAGENGNVIAMDDLYLLGFSTRTGTAVLDLSYLLHDELEPTLMTLLRADGRFNTALELIDLAGTEFLLGGEMEHTIFAPTDEAFATLPEGMLDGLKTSTISMQAVLAYHVIEGSVLADDLIALEGEMVQTVYVDGMLAVSVDDDGIVLNETAHVIETDHLAGNGVLHVIDSVLLPERP